MLKKIPKSYSLAFVALFLITAFYATYKLTESPPTWYDEGIYIQVAQSFEHVGTQSIQIAPGEYRRINFLTIGYPVIVPVSASMKAFGDTLLAARLPMVMFILLFALVSMYLIYCIAGPFQALLALALIATFPLLYGNGKNVLGEVPGLFYAMLALIALYKLEKRNFSGSWHYLWLGLAVGLTAASKPIFLLLPAGIVVALVFNIRSIPLRWKDITVGALAFTIPMMLWVFFQFGPDASASAILGYYANPYGVESVPTTIAENLVRFFKEATPLYAAALMGVWLVSIVMRLYRKEKVSIAEESAFAFSVLVMLAYLRTAGWYRYFFEALTMALVFAPISFSTTFSALRFKYSPHVVVAVLCGLSSIQLYQLNFSSWVAEYYGSTRSSQVQAFFEQYPDDRSIFIFNSPAAVVFLPHRNYYQYMQPTQAIGYGDQTLDLLKQGVPDDVLISKDIYEQDPSLFIHYAQTATAGAYAILSRK